jgi:hypothetical protein
MPQERRNERHWPCEPPKPAQSVLAAGSLHDVVAAVAQHIGNCTAHFLIIVDNH